MRNRAPMSLALTLLLTVVNSYSLLAQSGTSSALAGTVADISGAVIPNAQIKATEVDTGGVRTVVCNASGRFLFSQVAPGAYLIEVQAEGFGPQRSQPTRVWWSKREARDAESPDFMWA